MMNGGRGARAGPMNPIMQQGGINKLNPQQQMAVMQVMEMQANNSQSTYSAFDGFFDS
jgi:hypothetical protein